MTWLLGISLTSPPSSGFAHLFRATSCPTSPPPLISCTTRLTPWKPKQRSCKIPMVKLFSVSVLSVLSYFLISSTSALPTVFQHDGRIVSPDVFESLEELARIVDISYCVGSSGIQKPFACLSRCKDFEGFELITTWNTGPLLSDSCGYIALSHAPHEKRVIVAFRGTYSIANTIADLSTNPAEYAPFPSGSNDSICTAEEHGREPILPQLTTQSLKRSVSEPACENCTVHSGFLKSWKNTRCTIIPYVEQALAEYPDYKLVLVGHSLGGAVATLAALELQARGWKPHVTTFGEPRIGNIALNEYINQRFNLNATSADDAIFRRVTHVDDPVPLLPLEEWGYAMHAGEIYIAKSSVPPNREDLYHCTGNADTNCIAGGDNDSAESIDECESSGDMDPNCLEELNEGSELALHSSRWGVPKRYKLWQLFFAHRDYFWRLGLCVPSGYPWDWWKHENRTTDAVHEIHDHDIDLGAGYGEL